MHVNHNEHESDAAFPLVSLDWEAHYTEAKAFFDRFGHLDMPDSYRDRNGSLLKEWLNDQQSIRARILSGVLTSEQTKRLSEIGIEWHNAFDLRWERNYRYAYEFYQANGHLSVPYEYLTKDGFVLADWIQRMRKARQGLPGYTRLTEERVAKLDAIGMPWDGVDCAFERNYNAAYRYYETYHHLDVPASYINPNGIRLGIWIQKMRRLEQRDRDRQRLTEEQIARLSKIGMVWGTTNDIAWNAKYMEAKAFFEEHGHLRVPANYVTANGTSLGVWITSQRRAHTSPCDRPLRLSEGRVRKLDEIGMVWETNRTTWDWQYEYALKYYEKHGNVNVRADYVTDEGVRLGAWLYNQRRIRDGSMRATPLDELQIKKLDQLGYKWELRRRGPRRKTGEVLVTNG